MRSVGGGFFVVQSQMPDGTWQRRMEVIMKKLESWRERLFKTCPGLGDYTFYPTIGGVECYLMDRKYGGLANSEAEQRVKEAQAWQFFNEHPPAPRKWRSKPDGWRVQR